jgi:adenylate cyclase
MPEFRRSTSRGNGVLEMTNENFARLLKGLTIAVGNRKNRILFYQFLAAGRLTGLDEEGTHAQLQDHLRSLVEPRIAEHRGRVVKNTGDGLLAEFGSVVDAVRCAVDVQRGMAERNAEVPQEKCL